MLLFGDSSGDRWFSVNLTDASPRPATRRALCEACWPVSDLSPDGQWLLHDQPPRVAIVARAMSNGRSTELIRTAKGLIGRARISPDGHWVAFNGGSGPVRSVYVVPFRPGASIPETEWSRLTGKDTYAGHPEWSPDSRLVYYFSDRDGKFCVWGQRVNPTSGRPEGDPIAVWHFHDVRRSLAGVSFPQMGLAAYSSHLILSLSEMSGNIWMSQTATK